MLALGLGLGCGSPATTGAAQPTPPVAGKADDPTCPIVVAGTSLTVEDTEDGAALVFVTTGDAAAVQARSRALADMHNAKHAKMEAPKAGIGGHDHAGHAGHDHAGHDHAEAQQGDAAQGQMGQTGQMGEMIAAHSTATVAELPNGARVVFAVPAGGDAGALQSELRMHAGHLTHGTCEM